MTAWWRSDDCLKKQKQAKSELKAKLFIIEFEIGLIDEFLAIVPSIRRPC